MKQTGRFLKLFQSQSFLRFFGLTRQSLRLTEQRLALIVRCLGQDGKTERACENRYESQSANRAGTEDTGRRWLWAHECSRCGVRSEVLNHVRHLLRADCLSVRTKKHRLFLLFALRIQYAHPRLVITLPKSSPLSVFRSRVILVPMVTVR